MNNVGIATNKSILDLYNKMKTNEFRLRPDFQRKLVWNDTHKESFIETIVLGLPFPEIYLASGAIDVEQQISVTLVVDGQQRLNTIRQYISGDESLPLKRVRSFAQLDLDEKTAFLDYQVVVRDLGRIDEQQIQEIFKRINSVQYALNAIEIANALYDGSYISAAKTIADLEVFKDLEVFTDGDSARMRDIDFVLLVMTTLVLRSYFTASKEINDFIKRYDDDFPQRDAVSQLIETTFQTIAEAHIPYDSLWFRKSSFFSLVVELAKVIEKRGKPSPENLRAVLADLESAILSGRNSENPDDIFAAYYRYIFQNTSSRLARTTRGGLIESFFSKL